MSVPSLTSSISSVGESSSEETFSFGWPGSPDPLFDHFEVHGFVNSSGVAFHLDLPSKTSTTCVVVRGWQLPPGAYTLFAIAVSATGVALAAASSEVIYVGGTSAGGFTADGLFALDHWLVAGTWHVTSAFSDWYFKQVGRTFLADFPSRIVDDFGASVPSPTVAAGAPGGAGYCPLAHMSSAWLGTPSDLF